MSTTHVERGRCEGCGQTKWYCYNYDVESCDCTDVDPCDAAPEVQDAVWHRGNPQ